MSNSVSRFTTDSYTSSDISSFYLYAYDDSYVAYIVFNNIASATKLRIYKRDLSSQTYSYDLTKDQITHLLSLDCPDAFIAYALTLCPCSPEIPLTESSDDAVQVGKNEGNPFPPSPETSSCAVKCELDGVKGDSFIKSYPKKQDITYLQALKDIKAQIEFLNKCAFDKSILTSDEHFALLGIEEELNQLIHFDPIRPADDGLPLRYDHFNCFSLPDNLE